MANSQTALNIVGVGTTIAASTANNCSTALAFGVYAVWATTANAFISVAPSTSLTVTTGLPVLTTAAPTLINVPAGAQICTAGSTSGSVLTYMKVG